MMCGWEMHAVTDTHDDTLPSIRTVLVVIVVASGTFLGIKWAQLICPP